MASSPIRIQANRLNSLKSSKPRSAEGKARPCRNAMRRGLAARDLIVRPGEQDLFGGENHPLQNEATARKPLRHPPGQSGSRPENDTEIQAQFTEIVDSIHSRLGPNSDRTPTESRTKPGTEPGTEPPAEPGDCPRHKERPSR